MGCDTFILVDVLFLRLRKNIFDVNGGVFKMSNKNYIPTRWRLFSLCIMIY